MSQDQELQTPILVMGKHDQRSEVVECQINGQQSAKVRFRPDASRRHTISLNTPAGNFYEKNKSLSREDQIQKFKTTVFEKWVCGDAMPSITEQWLQGRVQEFNAGRCIDLVCDCRRYCKKPSGILHKEAPAGCHGFTIQALILFFAGRIKADNFLEEVENLRIAAEGRTNEDWEKLWIEEASK